MERGRSIRGLTGPNHEMVEENSPGNACIKGRPETTAEWSLLPWSFLDVTAANRSPFQGVYMTDPYPELKPWAVL